MRKRIGERCDGANVRRRIVRLPEALFEQLFGATGQHGQNDEDFRSNECSQHCGPRSPEQLAI